MMLDGWGKCSQLTRTVKTAITVRLPEDQAKKLAADAKANGRSLNAHICFLLGRAKK